MKFLNLEIQSPFSRWHLLSHWPTFYVGNKVQLHGQYKIGINANIAKCVCLWKSRIEYDSDLICDGLKEHTVCISIISVRKISNEVAQYILCVFLCTHVQPGRFISFHEYFVLTYKRKNKVLFMMVSVNSFIWHFITKLWTTLYFTYFTFMHFYYFRDS